MAKVVKKRNIDIQCRYCEYFLLSPMDGERNKIRERKCSITNKLVSTGTIICSKFKPNKVFWCDKESCWQYLIVCENRINKKITNCKKCKQYKILLKIKETYNE